jgi:DNA-binding transcriptional MerR regulator
MLPSIPAKHYFTIGEVSDLCGVKPYVLRYWEQEFTQLKPMKRRGNRRYYQRHEVLLIRRIRELLYEQGFTISGARNRLSDLAPQVGATDGPSEHPDHCLEDTEISQLDFTQYQAPENLDDGMSDEASAEQLRQELLSIRDLLAVA